MQDAHVKLNTELPLKKQHSTRKRRLYQQIGRKFKEETDNVLHLEHRLVFAETWTLRKVDQKYLLKVLKCGAGEGWRRSVGPIV
jgi:hypothetical protein